ncbi:hypothetical protein BG006_002690 [Podila minutissima]|uniref:Uncharacterized protein n=1 Tax=Podila minutissima TaxID=64525 RepID=A0A9P5S8X1_9FUNG|nr:hypothetical protein BG006_002690 [Podila minutissima]
MKLLFLLTLLLLMTTVRPAPLPAIGAEIPMSMLAINSQLKIKSSLSVDFRGGMKQRIDVDPNDPFHSVRARIVGFKVSAELPDNGNGEPSQVIIEQNNIDTDAKSTLRITQQFPPKFEHVIVLDSISLTIVEGTGNPMVLTNADPMTLVGTLTQFPPKGDLYQLQSPVNFVDPENPDRPAATLQTFPAKIGGL